MRNKAFVAKHRGGTLSKSNHNLLILWAVDCAEHVITLFTEASSDTRPQEALSIARAWAQGEVTVGEARKASVAAHATAREMKGFNTAASEVARAAGHAVATAHMADHSLQAATYALKALKIRSVSTEAELQWQNDQLPENIKNLVLEAREEKGEI